MCSWRRTACRSPITKLRRDTSPLIMACIFWSESLSGLKQSYWKYLETRSFCDSYMSKIVAMSQYEPRQGPPEETSGPPSAVPCFEVRVWQLRNPWQVVPCLLHGGKQWTTIYFKTQGNPEPVVVWAIESTSVLGVLQGFHVWLITPCYLIVVCF